MNHLSELRHKLHQIPEISGNEKETSALIRSYLQKLNPDQLFTFIGSYSLVAVFDSFKPGNTVIIRADIDAVPIDESRSALDYKSNTPGISHKCGHDGHATILYGLAEYVSEIRPITGKVLLLFQAAEETGDGASSIIDDLAPFKPDFCFGLHNLPGYPTGNIIIKDGIFASASEGMIITLKGIESHASEPEKGNNPAFALSEIIQEVLGYASGYNDGNDYSMITVTHASLGKPSFGISPSDSILMLTLRGSSDNHILKLKRQIKKLVNTVANNHKLDFQIDYSDAFPAVVNDSNALEYIRQSALDTGLSTLQPEVTFKWSEDFAHYRKICPSAFLGIGAGTDCIPVHNPDYDFPDEIIPTGVEIWKAIYSKLNL